MFYDFIVNKVELDDSQINEIGQTIKQYITSEKFMCDIQPSTSEIAKKTFGEDIESIYTMFCDEDLKLGTYILFNEIVYKVNSKIDWIDYKIYSLKGCDVNVN